MVVLDRAPENREWREGVWVSVHCISGGGDPNESNNSESNAFGSRQLFLAHSALSNLSTKQYLHNERVVREGWQARASTDTLDLQVAGINASMAPDGKSHRLTTRYPNGGILELALTPTKPLVRFGDRGLSRKGDGASSVSWYWTYTRLKARGHAYPRWENGKGGGACMDGP